MTTQNELIENLRRAVEDKGRVPEFHIHMKRQHQSEWPKLWEAIHALLNFKPRTYPINRTFVIAPSYQKAQVWCEDHDINYRSPYVYVITPYSPKGVYGMRPGEGDEVKIIYPNFDEAPYPEEFIMVLQTNGFLISFQYKETANDNIS
jgi:hypothetical protein